MGAMQSLRTPWSSTAGSTARSRAAGSTSGASGLQVIQECPFGTASSETGNDDSWLYGSLGPQDARKVAAAAAASAAAAKRVRKEQAASTESAPAS